MLETLFNAIFAGLIAGVLVWFSLIIQYLRYLRTYHPAVFRALGEPALFTNNTPRNNLRLLRYVLSSDCEETGDASLVAQTRTLRWFIRFYGMLFGLLLIAVMVIALGG